MRERVLRRVQALEAPIDQAFKLFSRAENLEAITPPLLRFRIAEAPAELRAGALIRYRLRLRGVPVSWLTRIEEWDPPHGFVDRQLRGPYALWHHTHTFEPLGPDRTRMVDLVRYGQRLGPLGALAEHALIRYNIDRIFDFRRESIPALIANGRRGTSRRPATRATRPLGRSDPASGNRSGPAQPGRDAPACTARPDVKERTRRVPNEEESKLAHFILLTKLTSDGVKTIKNNPARIREVNSEMEQLGIKVVEQWATMGRYDFVSIIEADDAATMARASVELGSRGTTTNETLYAFPSDEFAEGL